MPELSLPRREQLAAYAKVLSLKSNNKSEQESRVRTWEELLWACCTEDPWFFCRTLVRTKNEHGGEDSPYEPVPDKAYAKWFVRTWEEVAARKTNRLLFVAKSRQMMASWLCCVMALWTAMTKQAQLIIIQSKKEVDAGKLLERTHGIWTRLPPTVRDLIPCKYGHVHMDFDSTDSQILGIPEGGDQIRSNTASLLIGDESCFQPSFLEAYTAAQPSLNGGGMGVFVSSAAPGAFASLVLDSAD